MTPDSPLAEGLLSLVRVMQDIEHQAVKQYEPVVNDIVSMGCRDAHHIESTLDGMLDFCGHAPMLLMYRQLCRYYWQLDQAATAFYIHAYRERWDIDEQEDLA